MSDHIADRVARAKALDKAATPGPWLEAITPPEPEAAKQWIADCYDKGLAGPAWMVIVPCDDKPVDEIAKVVAVTGNGPTSNANAKFILESRALLPALAADVERLQAEVARLTDRHAYTADCLNTELRENYSAAHQVEPEGDWRPAIRALVDGVRHGCEYQQRQAEQARLTGQRTQHEPTDA